VTREASPGASRGAVGLQPSANTSGKSVFGRHSGRKTPSIAADQRSYSPVRYAYCRMRACFQVSRDCVMWQVRRLTVLPGASRGNVGLQPSANTSGVSVFGRHSGRKLPSIAAEQRSYSPARYAYCRIRACFQVSRGCAMWPGRRLGVLPGASRGDVGLQPSPSTFGKSVFCLHSGRKPPSIAAEQRSYSPVRYAYCRIQACFQVSRGRSM
jgi:hypothetical protein